MIVITPLMPGSAPTIMPMMTPSRMKIRYLREMTICAPVTSNSMDSVMASLSTSDEGQKKIRYVVKNPHPTWKREVENPKEHNNRYNRNAQRNE